MRNRGIKVPAFLVIAILLAWCGWAHAKGIWRPVDFSSHFNGRNQDRESTFPYGSPVLFNGLPFDIPGGPGVLNTWDSNTGSGLNSVDINVGIYGVERVFTLINTSWGQAGGPYTWLEFFGSDGAYYRKDLYGNVDIRDWNQASWTNSINGTTTINVFTNSGGNHRIDLQIVLLPADFLDETLVTMRLSDNGGSNFQRAFLYGVTAAVLPLPPSMLLLGSGLLGLAGLRRLKK